MISFQPQKEEELGSKFSNLPPGNYPFTVLDSQEQASKSEKNKGRIMCAVKLNVHGPTSDRHVYDYFAPDWLSPWKLKHFMETTGKAQAYLTGNVDATGGQWKDWQGFVKIGVETDSKRGEKNVVADYLPKQEQTVEALDFSDPTAASRVVNPVVKTPGPDDEDVPF